MCYNLVGDFMNIDIDKLREDLINYFGTAMASGFGMAVMDLSRVERASDEELIRIALDCGFDLNDYVILNK